MEKQANDTVQQKQIDQQDQAALWKAMKAGDPQAFERIYRTHVQLVYRYACQLTNDQELIDDCIQDLFAEIWKKRERLGEVTAIHYYLYASVRRKILRKCKARGKYLVDTPFSEVHIQENIPSYESDLICSEENSRQKKLVKEGLQALNQVQRQAIMLKYYQNLSYQEIAEQMSLNVTHVYKIVARGLKAMEQNIHKVTLWLIGLIFFC